MPGKATIDFETRSACDLRKHGSWPYSEHPSTEAMCMSYKLPGMDKPKRWHMAHPQYLIAESPPPKDLFKHIAEGGLVEAHNAFFERMIMTDAPASRANCIRKNASKRNEGDYRYVGGEMIFVYERPEKCFMA